MRYFFLLFILVTGASASRAQYIKWYIEPVVDSVNASMLTEYEFAFTADGKTGYFRNYKGVVVPPRYESVRLLDTTVLQNDDHFMMMDDLNMTVFLVMKNGKYGLYDSRKNREILPCQYTKLESRGGDLVWVSQGRNCGQFSLEDENFTIEVGPCKGMSETYSQMDYSPYGHENVEVPDWREHPMREDKAGRFGNGGSKDDRNPDGHTIIYSSDLLKVSVVKIKDRLYRRDMVSGRETKLPFIRILDVLPDDSLLIVSEKKQRIRLYNLLQQKYVLQACDTVFFMNNRYQNNGCSQVNNSNLPNRILTKIFAFSQSGKYGVINRDGKIALKPEYDSIYYASDRTYDMHKDKPRDLVILHKFGKISIYEAGPWRLIADNISQLQRVVKSRNAVDCIVFYWYRSDGKWGYELSVKGKTGQIPAYDTFYDRYHSFIARQGAYSLLVGGDMGRVQANPGGKTKVLYDSIWWEKSFYYFTRRDGKYGVCAQQGNEVLECKADTVYYVDNCTHKEDFAMCVYRIGNMYGLVLPYSGVTPPSFTEYRYGCNHFNWVRMNGKWGIVRRN